MKKIILFLLLGFFLVSCGSDEPGIVETVDTYIETLDSSIQDAKAAAEIMNTHQSELNKSLEME